MFKEVNERRSENSWWDSRMNNVMEMYISPTSFSNWSLTWDIRGEIWTICKITIRFPHNSISPITCLCNITSIQASWLEEVNFCLRWTCIRWLTTRIRTTPRFDYITTESDIAHWLVVDLYAGWGENACIRQHLEIHCGEKQ